MRLLSLDLEKYGAFEGRSLAFRPDARLHLVYGPNEAGKSSALSAVGDLLFGFGARTDFAFRHATGDLRLGATVSASDGQTLAFRRRKGNKATLIDANDQPLRDDLLTPFLGQLNRETFERAFGLASDSLRKGADDLLAADGDGAASLFAAASGLRGVETLRRALDDQADALFTPQARTKPFNDLSKRYDVAQAAQRDSALGATQWKRANDEIADLERRHQGLQEERDRVRTDRARLDRLLPAHRAAVALGAARRALEEFGEAPDVAPDALRAIVDRLSEAEEADKALARAMEALKAGEEGLAAAEIDAPALDAAREIEALVKASGAFAKTLEDLPRVRREAEEIDEALARLARRLGLSPGVSVETAMPSDAARDHLAGLVREGREIARERRAAEAAAEKERVELDRLDARRGGEAAIDPRPLREAFSALGARLRSLDRREELAREHAREADALAEAAGRLSPPVPDLDRLASRPLPAVEWIARMRRDLERLGAERALADDLGRAREDEARKVEAELGALASDGPIASPGTIRAAREAREAEWRPIRAALAGGPPAGDVQAYERAVAEADRLADRLADDARRAAQKAGLERRRLELGEERRRADEARATLHARTLELEEAWRGPWRDFGVDPGRPEEMESWRKAFSALIERREALGRRAAQVAALDAVDAALRPELLALAASAGLADVDRLDALALGGRIDARLSALSDRFGAESALATQIAEATRRRSEAEREAQNLATREAGWRARWAAALPPLGLGPDASFDAVEAALAAWREAPGLVGQRDGLVRRVKGMERDESAFLGEVSTLVGGFAPELADLPPQAAAERLGKRLAVASASKTRRDDALERRDVAAVALERAERMAAEAGRALEGAASGLGAAEGLRALLPRIEERARLARAVADRREQLLTLGGSSDEATLIAELDGFDPDAATAAIERLRQDEERADREAQQAWAELHAARAAREALGGAGAEQAAAQGRAAGAALYEMAREWSVMKLASLLLGAAIDRARAQDRSPTLERAGRLFATLTGGGFDGFAEDYEEDTLVLFGRRASGETVPVRGMSEGTRDQFYLALRLAALEDYASRAEPAPFIGDDLFASFDDARTAHGLKALAEVGGSVQPILFTHHRAVVETARRTLGDAADVIEIEPQPI